MNIPRKLTLTRKLTLATFAFAATATAGIASQAGAASTTQTPDFGVRWGVLAASIGDVIDTRCDGNNAITGLSTNLDSTLTVGDTITATWQTRPGCENTNVRIAAHATANLTFNPDETQPLIQASAAVLASSGRLVYTIPNGIEPGCNVQLDLITGDPLIAVSPTARYNEWAIGGQRSRLIAAGYATGECTPSTTSTTVDIPTTTLTTITVSNSTPISQTSTSFPVVDETTPDLVPTPSTAPGPGSPELLTQHIQRLPETGRGTGTVVLGTMLIGSGIAAWLLSLLPLRRRTTKEHTNG